MAPIKIFLLGLLLLGLINSGLSRPEPVEENDENYPNDAEDEYQDDDHDYAADYDDDTSKDVSGSQIKTSDTEKDPAYFDQVRVSKAANVSQTVVLACPIKNFDRKKNVVMWYNYTSLLFQKQAKLSKDPRISLDDNYSLHIKNVQVTDSNEYLCRVFPETVTHNIVLKVFGPFTHVSVVANERVVTGEKLVYDVRHPSPEFNGENLRLECRATGGNPAGRVTWSHKGEKLEGKSRHILTYNNTLELRHITRKQAGSYQCLADNGYGKPIHAHVDLIVTHKPTFLKEEVAVNTNTEETTDLHCKFEANPEPSHVHWYKVNGDADHQRIHDNDKYKIKNNFHNKHHGYSTTTLEIRNVDQQDLMEYNCEVQNSIGKARAKIFLGLTPATPQLVSHAYKGGKLTAKWEVTSHQPLSDINVMTRGADGQWKTHVTPVTDEHKPKNNVWTVKTEIDLENGDYEIQAKAKNADGWSAINSDTHKLHLEQDTDEIHVANIGGSGSISRASAAVIGLVLSFVLFI